MNRYHVVIPAAGFGSRMGRELPKQYLTLGGMPVIWHTLSVFLNAPCIQTVHVILSPEDSQFAKLDITHAKLTVHYCGGATRAQTVANGLDAIATSVAADDWVLVHDAARPCLSQALLVHLIDTLKADTVGGLLAIPLAETLKRSDQFQKVQRTEPRDHLWQAQTPQMFRYQLLCDALKSFAQHSTTTATDEAEAVEALGFSPTLVAGHLSNLKVTYPNDLSLAEWILQAQALMTNINERVKS